MTTVYDTSQIVLIFLRNVNPIMGHFENHSDLSACVYLCVNDTWMTSEWPAPFDTSTTCSLFHLYEEEDGVFCLDYYDGST